MNLKQLEAFVSVAEEGSFSKAAKALFLTQPTVSAHISSLEQELNVRLFVRNTKEVNLSDSGRILYEYAKQMVVLEKKIEAAFDGTRKEEGHSIRIAASTVPAQYLLPSILTAFSRKYPREQLKITETDSAGVVEQIVNHNADIGFTGTVLEKKHCCYIPFYRDELIVITPNTEKFRFLKEKDRINTEDRSWIQNEPVIMREEGSGTRKEAERLLKSVGIAVRDLNIVATIENQETIKRLVGSGTGISIISRLAAEEEIEEEKVLSFPLGGEAERRNINVIYNKNLQLTATGESFLRMVRKVYPENAV